MSFVTPHQPEWHESAEHKAFVREVQECLKIEGIILRYVPKASLGGKVGQYDPKEPMVIQVDQNIQPDHPDWPFIAALQLGWYVAYKNNPGTLATEAQREEHANAVLRLLAGNHGFTVKAESMTLRRS